MTLQEAIANRIEQLIKEQGITMYELAMSCGINKSIIYDIVGGRTKKPEVATIKKICDGFKPPITLGQFFSTPSFDTLEQEIK